MTADAVAWVYDPLSDTYVQRYIRTIVREGSIIEDTLRAMQDLIDELARRYQWSVIPIVEAGDLYIVNIVG